MANLLKIIFVIICLFQASECAKKNNQRLQTKLNIFIEDVVELKVKVQELREDVDLLQENNITAIDNGVAMCCTSEDAGEDNTEIKLSNSLKSLVEEFEGRLSVVKNGFREEKVAVRERLDGQGKSIEALEKEVGETRAEIDEKLTNTLATVSSVNDTLTEHLDLAVNEVLSLSEVVDKIKQDVTQVVSKLRNVTHLSEEINRLKAEVTDFKTDRPSAGDLEKQTIATMLNLVFRDVKQFGSSVYMMYKQPLTWAQAQQKCQENWNFHLAEINDIDEHEFVRKLVDRDIAWLGATDSEHEGIWQWSSSGLKVPDVLWNENEPNDSGPGGEDCVHSHGIVTEGLNDVSCDRKFVFVCELEL